jgi:hypothetical protein
MVFVLGVCLIGSAAFAQPVNDNFANRTLISTNNGTVVGTLSDATSETGEPLLEGVSSGQTAWWTWVAPSNGMLSIAASSTNFDPLVTVFSGDQLASLSLVASNNYLECYSDGICGCHWRMRDEVTLHVFRGQSYQISVDSPIFTDAAIEWTTNPAIPAGGGFVEEIPVDPADTNILIEGHGVIFTTNVVPGAGVNLALSFTPAPPNDDFANATKISGSRVEVAVNNSGATKEPGEPDDAGNPGGSSVWYSWKAPASGRVTLSTNEIAPYSPPSWVDDGDYGDYGETITIIGGIPDCGNLVDQNPPPVFYPLLAAYTGTSVNALTSADSVPIGLSAYPYGIEFDAVKGKDYHFACDGNMGTTNSFNLYVALTIPAINDVFARRIMMRGTHIEVSGYNAGASPQPGAPNIGNGSTGRMAWWSWTAPVNGPVIIDLSGSDFTFPLAVFTGSKLSELNMIASGAGSLVFVGYTGAAYQIAVGDASGQTGEIKMVVQAPVIAVPLMQVVRAPLSSSALLRYQATAGQVLQLQRSSGTNWVNLQQATAHRNEADFAVKPAPAANAPGYRAIVVSFVPQPN